VKVLEPKHALQAAGNINNPLFFPQSLIIIHHLIDFFSFAVSPHRFYLPLLPPPLLPLLDSVVLSVVHVLILLLLPKTLSLLL
jgi:hypothetical protein